ncbi:phosphotriesterase family protein [Cryobacterium soli]|uniref:phosphotriesterase family protein n=1 Tax=Cryobacterium soli TaxID=2220095 RepID=UPI000E760AE9|nr:aryldialkylphosphatase [Cryobacterium soli]
MTDVSKKSAAGFVQTVLGPVPAESLKRVMVHEHLLSLVPGPWLSGGASDDRIELAVNALSSLATVGVGTVVDISPYGVVGRNDDGSNAALLKEIAERTGLNIVSGTAVYLEAYSPRWALDASLPELAARFIADATIGIGETGVLAGVLGEQATSLGEITPHEEKCLRASARAARETGLGIMTHTTHGTMAHEQIDILLSEGVDLSTVVIGHMDTQLSLDYVRSVSDRGANVAIDTIGKQTWEFFVGPPEQDPADGEFVKNSFHRADSKRADLVAALVADGRSETIFLASDLTGAEVWMNPTTHGQQGYNYLVGNFLPMLRERGVTEEQCDRMLVSNPARLLARP